MSEIKHWIDSPETQNDKDRNIKDLHQVKKEAYKPAYKRNLNMNRNVLNDFPEDLIGIIQIWPELPEYIKAAIKALAQSNI